MVEVCLMCNKYSDVQHFETSKHKERCSHFVKDIQQRINQGALVDMAYVVANWIYAEGFEYSDFDTLLQRLKDQGLLKGPVDPLSSPRSPINRQRDSSRRLPRDRRSHPVEDSLRRKAHDSPDYRYSKMPSVRDYYSPTRKRRSSRRSRYQSRERWRSERERYHSRKPIKRARADSRSQDDWRRRSSAFDYNRPRAQEPENTRTWAEIQKRNRETVLLAKQLGNEARKLVGKPGELLTVDEYHNLCRPKNDNMGDLWEKTSYSSDKDPEMDLQELENYEHFNVDRPSKKEETQVSPTEIPQKPPPVGCPPKTKRLTPLVGLTDDIFEEDLATPPIVNVKLTLPR